MPLNGLTMISKVAFEGISAAVRTSIGPDADARAFVSPKKVRMFVSRYGCKVGQMEVRQFNRLGSSPRHTLTETKGGKAIKPDKFDMEASHRLRMSIRRPGHLE